MQHLVFLAAAACGLVLSGPALAEDAPSGTIKIESTSIALGIGVTWGEGELTYQGKVYKLAVNGLSVVDLGVSGVTAIGKIYHMNKLEDFPGNSVAGQVGVVLGGGVSGTHCQHWRGEG